MFWIKIFIILNTTYGRTIANQRSTFSQVQTDLLVRLLGQGQTAMLTLPHLRPLGYEPPCRGGQWAQRLDDDRVRSIQAQPPGAGSVIPKVLQGTDQRQGRQHLVLNFELTKLASLRLGQCSHGIVAANPTKMDVKRQPHIVEDTGCLRQA